MKFLPEVIHAKYAAGHIISLRFNDGTEKNIDFSSWLQGPVFEPLKDTAYFRKFFIDGGTVCWPNGADIAPETLYAAPDYLTHLAARASRTKFDAALRRVPNIEPVSPDKSFRK